MSNIECPICKSQATKEQSTFDGEKLACSRCGNFSITRTAADSWKTRNPNLRQIANTCGWIREHQEVTINSDQIEFLSSMSTPNFSDRAAKILLAIAKLSTEISYKFNLESNKSDYWLGVSYSSNPNDLNYLFQTYLKNEINYLSFEAFVSVDNSFAFLGICITPKGYTYLDSLKHTSTLSQIGFCAMWFDETVLPIWVNAIMPAIKDAGYDPKRIDGHHHNNKIDDEIIAMLRRSKFVVADFTGQRGGVYFEAGFALGLGLQVIWTCKKSDLKEVHFDNRQYNFVIWEEDKLDDFKAVLQNRIEATIGRGNLANSVVAPST